MLATTPSHSPDDADALRVETPPGLRRVVRINHDVINYGGKERPAPVEIAIRAVPLGPESLRCRWEVRQHPERRSLGQRSPGVPNAVFQGCACLKPLCVGDAVLGELSGELLEFGFVALQLLYEPVWDLAPGCQGGGECWTSEAGDQPIAHFVLDWLGLHADACAATRSEVWVAGITAGLVRSATRREPAPAQTTPQHASEQIQRRSPRPRTASSSSISTRRTSVSSTSA
jgi:hypothetical protein